MNIFVPPLKDAYGIPWGYSEMKNELFGTYRSGSLYPIPASFPGINNPPAFTGLITISIMFWDIIKLKSKNHFKEFA